VHVPKHKESTKIPQSWYRQENIKSKKLEPFLLKLFHSFYTITRYRRRKHSVYYRDIQGSS